MGGKGFMLGFDLTLECFCSLFRSLLHLHLHLLFRHVIMVGNYGKEIFEDCTKWLKEKDEEGGKSVNPMV